MSHLGMRRRMGRGDCGWRRAVESGARSGAAVVGGRECEGGENIDCRCCHRGVRGGGQRALLIFDTML